MLPLLGSLVMSAAPLLSSFFTSDKKPVVEAGLRFASTALGCAPSEEEVRTAIEQDPMALIKLKEYETTQYSVMMTTRVELERLRVEDVQGARNMAQNSLRVFVLQFFMAMTTVVILCGLICAVVYLITRGDLSKVDAAILSLLSTALGGAMMSYKQAMDWCFGANSSATDKDEKLYRSAPLEK